MRVLSLRCKVACLNGGRAGPGRDGAGPLRIPSERAAQASSPWCAARQAGRGSASTRTPLPATGRATT